VNAVKLTPDTPKLRVRHSVDRKRRRLLRVDIGLGLLAAIAAVVLAPGLGVVAVVALAVLMVCFVSLAIGQWRSRRR
jgi:Flp pilus assembly protein TadB